MSTPSSSIGTLTLPLTVLVGVGAGLLRAGKLLNSTNAADDLKTANGKVNGLNTVAHTAEGDEACFEIDYLTGRANKVQAHFEGALGQDDFLARLEVALFAYNFHAGNSIAMINLCRNEATDGLKQKIQEVFTSSFVTGGLGGVLTCGVTGMRAGLVRSSSRCSGRPRYVFFSFPHISINAKGEVGPMSFPGRPCACGTLCKAWNELRSEGLSGNCKIPGVHDALDPEYTIMKQRIARRLKYEGATEAHVQQLTLTELTQIAERTITDDLEFLISQVVDPSHADYAVVTGVQIHNWGSAQEEGSPNLEFVQPTSVYVIVNGQRTHLDIASMPSLTPRQMRLLLGKGQDHDALCNQAGHGTLLEMDAPADVAREREPRYPKPMHRVQSLRSLMVAEGLESATSTSSSGGLAPADSLQARIGRAEPRRCSSDNSTTMDQIFLSGRAPDDAWERLGVSRSFSQHSSFAGMAKGGSFVGTSLQPSW